MARYLGPKAKLSRREGTDLFLKSARRPIGDKAKFDSQARPARPHLAARAPPTSACSCARSRRSSACTACSSASSAATSPRPSAARATPARTCCCCSNRAWTTSSTAWASARRAPKRASWSRTRRITVNGEVVNIASYLVKAGDTVAVREKAKKQLRVTDALKLAEAHRHARLGAGRRDQARRRVQEGCPTATSSAPTSRNR